MAQGRTIKVGRLYREVSVPKGSINVDKRTVDLSFSSESDEVERYFGVEILDHSPGAVDLKRLKRSGALLIDHDPRNQVGVIEEVTIGADRKGRAVVRFGRSAKAEEIFQDVCDEIRRNVSVGYEAHAMELERTQKDGPDVYRVTKWEPFEISLVSIPADISVGVGRAEGQEREITITIPEQHQEVTNMKCDKCGAALVEGARCACETASNRSAAAASIPAAAQPPSPSAQEMEKSRIRAIENLCKANKIDDQFRDHWVNSGLSLEQVSDDMLRILEERGRLNPQPVTKIGLTGREIKKFSLSRAVVAAFDKNWTNAGFELECSRAIVDKLNRIPSPNAFFVPFEVMQRPAATSGEKRDLTVAGSAGYLVQTDNVGFIDLLRNRSVVFRMGATRLSGLQGSVMIPKMTVGATATWLANEASTANEQTQTFVQVGLSPKNVAAYTEISRQLLLQSSPGVEGIINNDLAQSVALAADYACLAGAGSSGEPDGIIGYSGVGSFTGTSLAYAGILDAQTDVASANVVPVRGGYVTTPAVAALMMQRVKYISTASPLWEGNLWDGTMAGFPAMSSIQCPTGDMIFGDWSQMVVGEWGVLEVETNPYQGFTSGIIAVRAIYSMDVAHRIPAAFSIATSIT